MRKNPFFAPFLNGRVTRKCMFVFVSYHNYSKGLQPKKSIKTSFLSVTIPLSCFKKATMRFFVNQWLLHQNKQGMRSAYVFSKKRVFCIKSVP